jgi:S1-C subfamily serine protease
MSVRGLRILISVVSNPGNSGGPVLTLDGRLLGLLQGNLTSPVKDEAGRQVAYLRPQRDPGGEFILGADGKPQFEIAPLTENSGISIATPTRFILDLARRHGIHLE